jgi:hypothetical protein
MRITLNHLSYLESKGVFISFIIIKRKPHPPIKWVDTKEVN